MKKSEEKELEILEIKKNNLGLYELKCSFCNYQMIGISPKQVQYNMLVHKRFKHGE